eukprot:136693_1
MCTRSKVKHWDILARRYSLPLLCGILAAIIHSNVSPTSDHYFCGEYVEEGDHFAFFPSFALFGEYHLTFRFLINRCFMLYFFGFVVKHIIESLLPPNGTMYPLKRALPPIISSCCGVMTPILLYISFVSLLVMTKSNTEGSLDTLMNGWAVPMSTDVALSWAVSTFIFNDHLDHYYTSDVTHSCIAFLLLLAVVDDVIGLIVLGAFYTEKGLSVRPIYLLIVLGAVLMAFVSNRYLRITKWWFYIFVLGGVSWVALLLTGIHSALALIPIMPFMLIPNTTQQRYDYVSVAANDQFTETDTAEQDETVPFEPYSMSMLNGFETNITHFVQYGLFFFTYVNAGVQFTEFGEITMCVFLSALLGKTISVSFGSYLVNKLFKIPLPLGMKLKQLPLIGFCASMNLTLSLFVSNVAFIDLRLKDEAKMGALCVAVFAIIGAISYRIVFKKRKK